MFAVHVDEAFGPRPFVQIIYILGYDQQLALPNVIQPRDCVMRRIWFCLLNGFAAHIVKAQHKVWITREAFGRCNVFDTVFFPQSTFIAKRPDATFGTHPRAREDDNVANFLHRAHEAQVVQRAQDMTSIGIIGRAGRMGNAIAEEADVAGVRVAGGIDQGEDPAALSALCDVLIDFSSPTALLANIGAAVAKGKAILIGTTGLNEEHHRAIDDAAHHVAVLQTGNTSLGVTLLARLVREAAAKLGPDWDIEISEMHHRMKVDAPSGTALLLGEAAAQGRAIDLSKHSARGRDGHTGAREAGSIGFASLRGGSVAGDHMVIFAADDERIELTHRADNRRIFARGAVKAAVWLSRQPAGRYSMDQVLGL
jgi:4-hydroxy-tetrahydrodipicolinate reductase